MSEDSSNRISPSLERGLSAEQVAQKTAQGQVNHAPEPITKSTARIISDNLFTSFNAFVVAIAACIALVGAYQNLLFLMIIVANTLIGIIQEIRSKKTIEKLSVLSVPKARVLRDGRFSTVDTEALVLDDLIELTLGNQICADCIVRQGQVEVNESLLTGEADPVYKKPGDVLLSGSFVISGRCLAQVEHVGADNYATKIALEAKRPEKYHSELMESLRKITKSTSLIILPMGLILFLRSYFLLDETIQTAVVSSAAAIIGMFPQGLVLLTSVSLAVGVIKLGRRRTLVQQLFCIETLSRVDVLCLDKTGTLTTGEMSVLETLPLLCLGGIAGRRSVPMSPLLRMKTPPQPLYSAILSRSKLPIRRPFPFPLSASGAPSALQSAALCIWARRTFCCRMPATRCTAPCSTIRATAAACCCLPTAKRR